MMLNKNKKQNRDQYTEEELYSEKSPSTGDSWPKKELFLLEPKTFIIIAITSLLTLAISFFGDQGIKFLTSVLSPIPAHAPFDGTVHPIAQVPNWVKLTEQERKAVYSAIPQDKLIPMPTYDPARLALPIASLRWNNPEDDAVRNEKITYSVPYMGNYKLDGLEYNGGHAAVDIKCPEGCPVYSVMNGTVVKVVNQDNGGFGKHVVIQTDDVPSLEDQSIKTTYFASYSHLSSASVRNLQVVTKGELIGYSGMTGTATTPHLHFQIDKEDAKWHPYWPFTSSDMKAAGVGFFEAINRGIGRENGIRYTIHPLRFVQKYFKSASQVAVASTSPIPETVVSTDQKVPQSFVVQLQTVGPFIENGEALVVIQAFDTNGNLVVNPRFDDEVKVSLRSNERGNLSTTSLSAAQFATGIVSQVRVSQLKPGKNKVLVNFRNREYSSDEFEVTAAPKIASGVQFSIPEMKGSIGSPLVIILQGKDDSGKPMTENFSLDSTIDLSLDAQLGILNLTTLTAAQFQNGQAILTFTPQTAGTVNIYAVYKGATVRGGPITISEQPIEPTAADTMSITSVPIEELTLFNDIARGSEYFTALRYLKERGLVAGYPDGTFQPQKPVSRVEAITFILRAIDEKVAAEVRSVFPDVPVNEWFGAYVATAFDLGFVKGYPDGQFRPEQTVNLAEFLTMLFVAAKADVDPKISITLPADVAESDWFAPQIQLALKKNIIEAINGVVAPDAPLTRGKVAQIIYKVAQLDKAELRGNK